MGHSDPLRAQLTAFSTVVVMTSDAVFVMTTDLEHKHRHRAFIIFIV